MKTQSYFRYLIIVLSGALFWLLLGLVISPALAARPEGATITVNTTADELNGDGDCSLREAVRAANLNSAVDGCTAGSGADIINVPAGTYTLTIAGAAEEAALTGDLDITDAVSIEGVSADGTVIRSAVSDRVFHVQSGVVASFDAITIRNGAETVLGGGGLKTESGTRVEISSSYVLSNTSTGGGGINNSGIMTITQSLVAYNSATTSGGGAIITGPVGRTTLIRSTVRNNEADYGGALSTFNGDFVLIESTVSDNEAHHPTDGGGAVRATGSTTTIDIINSTLSGNSSVYDGGAVYAFNSAVINLYNATVANNSTGGSGGGLNLVLGASVNMVNSILGDNTGGSNSDCDATINSLGYNLIENDSVDCTINGSTTGVVTGVDPSLGPLQDNGGPTFTQALVGASAAVNGGNPAGCADVNSQPLTTDQRGFPRPVGGVCDMGAFEADVAVGGMVFIPVVLR